MDGGGYDTYISNASHWPFKQSTNKFKNMKDSFPLLSSSFLTSSLILIYDHFTETIKLVTVIVSDSRLFFHWQEISISILTLFLK